MINPKNKRTVIKRETVLILLNNPTELTILPMIAAIQACVSSAILKHKAFHSFRNELSDYAMHLDIGLTHSPDFDSFLFLLRVLVPSIRLMAEQSFFVDEYKKYDCIFDLDELKARAIGYTTQRHLAQAFGIMLGAEASSFPTLVENLCPYYSPGDSVLTSLQFMALASRSLAPVVNLMVRDSVQPLTFVQRIQQVFECQAVVDVASFETYLASCLGKPVLELNADNAMTKLSNPKYLRLSAITDEALQKGLKLCLPDLCS